jgi:hypothetical protein
MQVELNEIPLVVDTAFGAGQDSGIKWIQGGTDHAGRLDRKTVMCHSVS